MATSVPLDQRLIRVSIEVDGEIKQYDQNFGITASGMKFANPLQNEAKVKIANLTKSDRDYLLTATSPFNKSRKLKTLKLEAGRVSSGLSLIYQGDINKCYPSQPPDIWVEFDCLTGQYVNGKLVQATQPGQTKLSTIAKQIAADTGLNLNFQATDKNISNYSFTGSAGKQINGLGSLGAVSAYQDDGSLIVKDIHLPLSGQIRILDKYSGMVGIPQLTELGVKVKYLIDKESKLGGALQISSVIYPTINGKYVIFKLGFELASREEPFYFDAECLRVTDTGAVAVPNTIKKQKKTRKKK
jgi:hypothetical protein